MPTKFYRLDDQNNVVEGTLRDINFGRRIVGKDNIKVAGVVCEVSTVFMPIDHGFGYDGPPIVFETMIFGGVFDGYQDRYSTWAEAERGHARAIAMLEDKRKIVKQCFYLIRYMISNKWWGFKYFISRKVVLWKPKKKD